MPLFNIVSGCRKEAERDSWLWLLLISMQVSMFCLLFFWSLPDYDKDLLVFSSLCDPV